MEKTMSNWRVSYSDELYHYGVPGMKWGVRRYQPYGQGGYNPSGVSKRGRFGSDHGIRPSSRRPNGVLSEDPSSRSPRAPRGISANSIGSDHGIRPASKMPRGVLGENPSFRPKRASKGVLKENPGSKNISKREKRKQAADYYREHSKELKKYNEAAKREGDALIKKSKILKEGFGKYDNIDDEEYFENIARNEAGLNTNAYWNSVQQGRKYFSTLDKNLYKKGAKYSRKGY